MGVQCMPDLLVAKALRKEYGQIEAVKSVDFSIKQGSCFGFLGPNGAGKTTTLEMLEGINQPSSGQILYKSEPLGPRFKEQAGIMFQSTSLQDFLTVRESLNMFAALYAKNRDHEELIERCSLGNVLEQDTRKLSGGQRQRLLLAIALVNEPEVIFLDEPTTGLDPQARRNFWVLLKNIKEEGKTIILTTHYMEEAYQLCDELVFMDHGMIIAQGTPHNLLQERFDDVIFQLPYSDVSEAIISHLPNTHKVDNFLEISSSDVNSTIQQLLAAGVSLSGLRIRSRNLEDLFLELTGKELRS